jgi:hypothetical protein
MTSVKKITAACALAVAGLAAAVAPAAAVDHDHTNTAPMGGLVNVNGDVLSNLCVAPWHWDGPIQVLTDNAPYQACQEDGGTQTDAPQVDLSHDHPFPLAR